MSRIVQMRENIVPVGWLLLLLAIPVYLIAISRSPHLSGASIELGFYMWGLCFMVFGSLACAAFGTGRRRAFLAVASLVVAYLWISYIGMEIMRR
jgi:hypothetical protein